MFSAQRVSRVVSLLAIAATALTQACSDAASPGVSSDNSTQLTFAVSPTSVVAANECATPASGWIFCDDFESDRLSRYFEVDNAAGRFARTAGTGWGGSTGMRGTYDATQSSAGRLSLAFGKVPDSYFRTVDAGVAKYRDVFWRFFVRREPGWVGNGAGGLTRATIFASSNWSQAMLANASSDATDSRYLRIDAFSGTDAGGRVQTLGYNDAAHLRSLASLRSATPIDDPTGVGQWVCYEFHVRLNDNGKSNGVYEFAVNGQVSARRTGLNWVGRYSAYGINALNLENSGSGVATGNARTIDNLVVSTSPIGCGIVSSSASLATISVALDSASLTVPHQAQATATLRDSNGNVMAGSVTWSSSNAAVATVSSAGVVTAIGAGTANIIATSGGKSGQAAINVVVPPAPVALVTVSLAANSVLVGGTTQATATTRDAGGNVLTGRAITWTSSNTAVATVSSAGLVTGVAAGSADIIAISEGKSGQATLSVTAVTVPVASVTVSLAASSLAPGGTTQATATARDANGNVLTGRALGWSSSNGAVATVSASGVVTAVAAGSANIVATVEGKTGQAAVTVAAPIVPVASVTVSLGASSVTAGATTQATAVTRDANGNVLTGRAVAWSSSNSAVATVSAAGVVTAVAAGSANIIATSEGKSGQAAITVTTPIVPVATVTVSLAASSVTAGGTTQATATARDANGNVLTGRSVTWSSSNTAVATVSSTGLVTAVVAGSASIIATVEGKVGQATLTVAAPVVPVATVTVSLAASSVTAGGTTQATATTRDANGNVLTGRAIAWSSSNTAVATVSAAGLVTAVTPGSANIVATSEGKSGQAAVTVLAVPVATVSVSLGAGSLTVGSTTQATATTRDANGNVLTGRTVTWSSGNSAVATVSSSGLVTAAAAGSANIVATSEGKSGQATLTVTSTPPPPPPTTLFEEKFEDTNLSGRGWYDLVGTPPLSTTEHISGSTRSLQVAYAAGATTPSPSPQGRHLFTPTNSVYLRYWVKYSSNWVGSGKSYHPHEFYFLTTEDDMWSGLASTFLTTYVEANFQNGVGTAVLASQDAKNIDATRIGQDLTNVTENRGVAGCNGNPDGTIGDCYQSGGVYYNGRTWRSASPVFQATAGAGYKGDWHMVEAYFKLNSIVNGKAQPDGVAQYWFDGQLVIDRQNAYLRTAAHPNMQFNQLIFGPYIGDGSPVAQTMWVDDLLVGTSRPTP